jgi:hypothetical protein
MIAPGFFRTVSDTNASAFSSHLPGINLRFRCRNNMTSAIGAGTGRKQLLLPRFGLQVRGEKHPQE